MKARVIPHAEFVCWVEFLSLLAADLRGQPAQ